MQWRPQKSRAPYFFNAVAVEGLMLPVRFFPSSFPTSSLLSLRFMSHLGSFFNVFVHDCLSVSKPLEQIFLCEGSRPNHFPNNSGCSLCIVCDLSQFRSNPSP